MTGVTQWLNPFPMLPRKYSSYASYWELGIFLSERSTLIQPF